MESVEFRMKGTFRKMGNSTMITIPAEIVAALNIEHGQEAVIETGQFNDKPGLLIVPVRGER